MRINDDNGIFGVNYPFKELYIFTKIHNIYAINKYFVWDFQQKAISQYR